MSDVEFGLLMRDGVSASSRSASDSLKKLMADMRSNQAQLDQLAVRSAARRKGMAPVQAAVLKEQRNALRAQMQDARSALNEEKRIERERVAAKRRAQAEILRNEKKAAAELAKVRRKAESESSWRKSKLLQNFGLGGFDNSGPGGAGGGGGSLALMGARFGPMGAAAGAAGELVIGAAVAAEKAWLGIGAAVAGATYFLAEAGRTSSRLDYALEKLTGRKTEIQDIAKLSLALGIGFENSAESYSRLLKMQFGREQAKEWLMLGADMKALGSTEDDIAGTMLAISQIKAKNRLQQQELNQLSDRNISTELVHLSLARKLGKSVKEIQKMQEGGQISWEMAEGAIKEAILQKLHIEKAGDAAREYAKTFDGAMARVSVAGEVYMLGLGRMFSKGFDGTAFNKFLDDLADPASKLGWQMLDIGRAAKSLGKIFSELAPVGLEAIMAFVSGFAKASGLNVLASDAKGFAQTLRDDFVPWAGKGGEVIGKFFGGMTQWNLGTVQELIRGTGVAVGTSLGEGIIQGIKNATGYTAVKEALSGMIGSARESEEVHSPSRKWARLLGKPLGQGAIVGYKEAFNSGAMSIDVPTASLAAGGYGAAGKAGGHVVHVGGIVVNVETSGESLPRDTLHELEIGITELFGRVLV